MLGVPMRFVMNNYKHITTTAALTLVFCAMAVKAQVTTPDQVNLDSRPVVEIPTVNQSAFKVGEKLTYRLHYGFIDAGEATVEVKSTDYSPQGRELVHVVGKGRSLGAFNWFFKVRDRYESYIDSEGMVPWKFVRRIEEGGYKKSQDYFYHQDKLAVDNGQGKTFEIPAYTQDMISSFYYARSIDMSDAQPGDIFTVRTFMDDELFDLNIKYLGKENVKLRKGEFRCMKFAPVVQEGRVFKDADDLQVWITDDANKIPILVKAEILVGSIKMEVVEYEGLANAISKVD